VFASPTASTATGRTAPEHDPIAARTSSQGSASAEGAGPERRSTVVLRYLDVVLVAVAAPVALALGAPLLGFSVGAGAWLIQRIIAVLDRRLVGKAAELRRQLGLSLFEAFGRIWLLAGAIVVAGVAGGRADGLSAALTIFGAYSVAFAIKVLTGPPQRKAVR